MPIYLLKATLVWGFSLLLFEGLLRKNSYHAANRFYLLGTLLGGLLLPLVEVQWALPVTFKPAREFVQTTTEATEAITAATSKNGVSAFSFTPETLLLFLYAMGCGIALSRIVRDGIALIRLRRGSSRERLPDGCVLCETGTAHGPFSFFRTIFLSSCNAYTAGEFAIVISHERQHARLLHSVDMLAVQALKVALWFHPLIHLYAHRLRLVHEYEADEAAAQKPAVYGRFLVEQALASPVPTLTHAFHSPLKNRIVMLTQNKRSTGRALRYFLTFPLIVALVATISAESHSEERKKVGNKLYYKGHEFTMTEPKHDTVLMQDPVTGDTRMMVTTLESRPTAIDGEKIYNDGIVRGAVYDGKEQNATTEYFNRVKGLLGNLPDGLYVVSMSSPVIDKAGNMAYDGGAELNPCTSCKPQPGEPSMKPLPKEPSEAVMQEIQHGLTAALEKGFRFKPAEVEGIPVASFLSGDLDLFGKNIIVVQNGNARLRTR